MAMVQNLNQLSKSVKILSISSFLFAFHSNSFSGPSCDEQYSHSQYYNDSTEQTIISEPQNVQSEEQAQFQPIALNQPSIQDVEVGREDIKNSPEGQSIWEENCQACHASGVAGAPKIGDKNAWTQRFEKGLSTLVKNANTGFQGEKGFMPAKGGNSSLSNVDVGLAVQYMLSKSI